MICLVPTYTYCFVHVDDIFMFSPSGEFVYNIFLSFASLFWLNTNNSNVTCLEGTACNENERARARWDIHTRNRRLDSMAYRKHISTINAKKKSAHHINNNDNNFNRT